MGLRQIWDTADAGFQPKVFENQSITVDGVLTIVKKVCDMAMDAGDREVMSHFAQEGRDILAKWLVDYYPSFDERPMNRQVLCLYLKRLVSGELSHHGHVSKLRADTAIDVGTDAWTLVAQRVNAGLA